MSDYSNRKFISTSVISDKSKALKISNAEQRIETFNLLIHINLDLLYGHMQIELESVQFSKAERTKQKPQKTHSSCFEQAL